MQNSNILFHDSLIIYQREINSVRLINGLCMVYNVLSTHTFLLSWSLKVLKFHIPYFSKILIDIFLLEICFSSRIQIKWI